MNDTKGTRRKPANATVSELVHARLRAAGRRFHANDNIAEFIQGEAELKALEDEVAERMQAVLEALGREFLQLVRG